RRSSDLAARAVSRCVVAAAAVGRGVDVVPLRGRLDTRRILVAQGVGPGGDAGEGRVLLARQQAPHLGIGGGREMALRQFAAQAVAELRPAQRDGRGQQQGGGEKQAWHPFHGGTVPCGAESAGGKRL